MKISRFISLSLTLIVVVYKPPSILVQTDGNGCTDNLFDAVRDFVTNKNRNGRVNTDVRYANENSSEDSGVEIVNKIEIEKAEKDEGKDKKKLKLSLFSRLAEKRGKNAGKIAENEKIGESREHEITEIDNKSMNNEIGKSFEVEKEVEVEPSELYLIHR